MGRSFVKTAECRELLLSLEGVFRSDLRHTHARRVCIPLPRSRIGIEIDRLGSKWVLCRSPMGEAEEQDPVLGELLWLRPSGRGAEAIFLLEPNLPYRDQERKTLLVRTWTDRTSGVKRLFARVCFGESMTEEWFTAESAPSSSAP